MTEALEAAHYMMNQGLLVVPSGRAGGVLDSPEKEIGLALGCCWLKAAPQEAGRERPDSTLQ